MLNYFTCRELGEEAGHIDMVVHFAKGLSPR